MGKKIIIGLVGEMAAGKSTATEYLKQKYSAATFRFSDMLRDVAKRLHIEASRANLQNLSTVLRQNFGEDLMSKVLAADAAESTHDFIIIEGIRRPTDAVYLKELPGFHMVALVAEERTRFDRLKLRSENSDDQTKTWEQFQTDGKQESEQKIKEVAESAEFTIDNNGSKDDLYRQLDEIVRKLRT